MAQLQLLIKQKDEIKLIGPRKKGRSYKVIQDKIIQALMNGYTPPDTVKDTETYSRLQCCLPDPAMDRLKSLAEKSGLSVCAIVRDILGLDY